MASPAVTLFIILSLTQLNKTPVPLPPSHGREGCNGSPQEGRSRLVDFCLLRKLVNLPLSAENNLFLVKRLIQRIDMRNPDPGPKRYTSLAWAAVLGNEETFEYLLNAGHDDQELSRVCYSPASTVRSF